MGRTVKDAQLMFADKRRRLPYRERPYFRALAPELHLGYRRARSGDGTWIVRFYVGERKYKTIRLGHADDHGEANGDKVLSFAQAQDRAREVRASIKPEFATDAPGTLLTVQDALVSYLVHRGTPDARTRVTSMIAPALGKLRLKSRHHSQRGRTLTADGIKAWHVALANEPPRVRTKKGQPQRHRFVTDHDAARRRKATANRTLAILRAALNRAWRADQEIQPVWQAVEPFPDVDLPRSEYLDLPETRRFVNATAGGFRKLAQAALLSGARYGELARLRAKHFDRQAGTIFVATSKTGRSRYVTLTKEGCQLFEQLAAGRGADDLLLVRDDGSPWQKSDQTRPMNAALAAANITRPIVFHSLRHSYATMALEGGMDRFILARNLGHKDTRMVERTYGHLGDKFTRQHIDKHFPALGIVEETTVRVLR